MKQLFYTALLIISSVSFAMDHDESGNKELEPLRKKVSLFESIRTNTFRIENSQIYFEPYNKTNEENTSYFYELLQASHLIKECDDFIEILKITRWIASDRNDSSNSCTQDHSSEKKNKNDDDNIRNLLKSKPLCPEYCQQVLSTEQHFNQHINFDQALTARRLKYISDNPEYLLFAMAQLMHYFYRANHATRIIRSSEDRQKIIAQIKQSETEVCYSPDIKEHIVKFRDVTDTEKARFRKYHADLKAALLSQDCNRILAAQAKIIPALPFNEEIGQISSDDFNNSLNPLLAFDL